LNTYKKVKQKLVGLKLDDACPNKQQLMCDDKEVGYLASCVQSPRFGSIALGYVRNEWTAPGTELYVAGEIGHKVVVNELPFGATA
jgi:glycine cleavage system aminomethyltransferase T